MDALAVDVHLAREQRHRDSDHPEQHESDCLTDGEVGARHDIAADQRDHRGAILVQPCSAINQFIRQ